MRAKEWQRDALVASIVWVISGFYCGMHFPVANALSNYKHCLRDGIAASSDCHRNFIEEWNTYSGYRVHAGLAVALVPIPLIGLLCYAASRRRKTNSNSTVISTQPLRSEPRVRTHSDPEGDDDGGQEVEGELVIASGHAPEVFETTEGCFDPPAVTIAPLIVPDRTFA